MRLSEAKRIDEAVMSADWQALAALDLVEHDDEGRLQLSDAGSLRVHIAIATIAQAKVSNLPNPDGEPVMPGEQARRTEKAWWT